MSTAEQEAEAAVDGILDEKTRLNSGRRTGPLAELVSMRMVVLFNLLRRSGVIAQKRKFDLSEVQWRIMSQVGQFAPLSLNSLAELLILDRGQLSRAVKIMVERGLLTRIRKPGGPEIEIGLSDQGRELHSKMVTAAIERDARLVDGLDPAEVAKVARVIDHMIAKAEVLMEDERELGGS